MKWVKEKKPTSYYLKGTRNFEEKKFKSLQKTNFKTSR